MFTRADAGGGTPWKPVAVPTRIVVDGSDASGPDMCESACPDILAREIANTRVGAACAKAGSNSGRLRAQKMAMESCRYAARLRTRLTALDRHDRSPSPPSTSLGMRGRRGFGYIYIYIYIQPYSIRQRCKDHLGLPSVSQKVCTEGLSDFGRTILPKINVR